MCVYIPVVPKKRIYYSVGDEKSGGIDPIRKKGSAYSDTNTQYKYTSNRKKEGGNMWSVDIRDPDIGGPILFQLYKK